MTRGGRIQPAAKKCITYVYVHSDHILVGYASGRWMRYTNIPLTVHKWMVTHPKQVKYIDLPQIERSKRNESNSKRHYPRTFQEG